MRRGGQVYTASLKNPVIKDENLCKAAFDIAWLITYNGTIKSGG